MIYMLTYISSLSAQVRFESVAREFEPLDDGLETSDVESNCPQGMVADGEICG